MGSLYLNNNESIILSTHNVIINTIPAEAILTNQRLIIVDTLHSQLRPQDIPFAALETVTIADTSAMDPALSLSIVMKDETRHTLGVVFPQAPKTRRAGERDEWAVKLKDASLNAQREHGVQPVELSPPWIPGALPDEAGDGGKREVSPEDKFRNPPLSPRKSRAAPGRGNRVLIGAGLVAMLIIVAVIGVYILGPSFTGSSGTKVLPTPTPEITAIPTEIPLTVQPTDDVTPEQGPTPEVTVETTEAPATLIPQTGVWLRIEYEGNYTASFGTAGRLRELTGSGNQFYQVPAKNEIVEATVLKSDNSGNALMVSFYNDGQLVKSGMTTNPHGTVDVHADLRTSGRAADTPAVTG